VLQPIGRKEFYTNRDLNKQEVDSFLYVAAQNFEVFQIFNTEMKSQKPIIAVDVLFKAYPMVPISCRYNLAGWYL
jgi:hypothetical protein